MSWLASALLSIHNWRHGVEKIKAGLQKDENPLRIGLLSAASINFAAIIDPTQTHPGATITAIAARNQAKAQAQIDKFKLGPSCKAYGSYADLLADANIDAVYIPLPNGLHFEWAVKAMEAGKHVLIEKPITSNAVEVRKLQEVSLKKNKVVLEAVHWRFHPATHAIKEMIESGKYGSPTSIYARLKLLGGTVGKGDIRYQYSLGGGSSMDLMYVLSGSTYFSSPDFTKSAIEISKATARIHETDSDIDEAMDVDYIVRPPNRPPVLCRTEADLRVPHLFGVFPKLWLAAPYLTIELEKAQIVYNNFVSPALGHSIVTTEKDDKGDLTAQKTTTKVYKGGPLWGTKGQDWWTTYRYQLDAFVDMVRAKDSGSEYSGPCVSLEESLKLMEVIDSVYDKAGLPRRGMKNGAE